jgi:alpha-D-xyloside xylohydrolase
MKTRVPALGFLLLILAASAPAQETRLVLDRGNSTIVLEPYAPNIIRVTLSLLRQPALSPPGYGFTGAPSAAGWTHQQNEQGDTYQSGRLSVTVAANRPRKQPPLPTQLDIAKYFNGSAPALLSARQREPGCSTWKAGRWRCLITKTARPGC